MAIDVTLNSWEYKACVDLANARMAVSNDRKMNNASTYKRTYTERMRQEVVGACGEMAVCKAMNWFHSPSVNTFHGVADIGENIEVRSSEKPNYSLILRDNDADDRWYVLVIGEPPNLAIIGRMRGADAKQDKWLKNPHGHRPGWFVPQSALTPIQSRSIA